jgi:hypothetical protein
MGRLASVTGRTSMGLKRVRRPSPATVISLIALFVALGGTGYAATQLPRNSVKAKQIAPGAVRSSEVKDGTLRLNDFKAGELPKPGEASVATRVSEREPSAAAKAAVFPPAEPVHYLTEDDLFGGWDLGGGGLSEYAQPGYQRDRFGYVWLQGSIINRSGGSSIGRMFNLPPGYYPERTRAFATARSNGGPAQVRVRGDWPDLGHPSGGEVNVDTPIDHTDAVFLDGIVFRCGPSGVDGCP